MPVLKYIGDGRRFVPGRSTDPERELTVSDAEAAGLIGTGLYALAGDAPAVTEEPEPPATDPDPEPEEEADPFAFVNDEPEKESSDGE